MIVWILTLTVFVTMVVCVYCFRKITKYTPDIANFVSKRYEKAEEKIEMIFIGAMCMPILNKVPEKFKITINHNGKNFELSTTKNIYENLIDGDTVNVLIGKNGRSMKIGM